MLTITLKRHAIVYCCVGLFGAAGVTAQEQLILEEVVVTAQKRAESLSDVPISVNVMSGEKIAQAGITNLNDLSDFVPNLTLNQTGLSTSIAIRGISSGISPAFEQSVGMYIDDVYYGRSQLARVPYLDPDRVEILRGPQPILFGKNAIAGAISMTTRRPSLEGVEGFVQAEYNFDQEVKDLQFGVNLPAGDTFAARIAGLYRDSEGYYENTTLNRDESANEEYLIRGSFLFEPTDELALSLKLETGEFDTEGRFLEIVNPTEIGDAPSYADVLRGLPVGAVELDTRQDFKRQSNGDIEENEFNNATFTVDYALGEHTLTAITGYVDYEFFLACDCDFTNAVILDTAGYEEFEQFSQELRLTSPGGETIDYIVGAFYQTYELETDDITNFPATSVVGLLLPPLAGTGVRRAYETDSDLWSVFAQATWNVSDVLRLTVGGRYTAEDKTGSRRIDIVDVNQLFPVRDIAGLTPTVAVDGTDATDLFAGVLAIDSQQVNASGLTGCGGPSDSDGHNLDCDRDEAKFTPAINAQWDVNDEIMAYASLSTGFKAGGFDTRANNTGSFEFEEEEALSFELGAKMTMAGGAAELNVALYRTEYTDLQTSQFDGTLGFNVTNAGEATTQGIELDGRWQARENLLLTGSFAWLDFEFDEFPNSECFFGESSDYPAGDPLEGLCDRSGDTREFTPEITANVGAQYFVPIGDYMEVVFGLDLAYSDEYFVAATLDPNLEQDSYFKLNGRIALSSQEGNWEVALLLENLTDEEILTFGNRAPLSTTLTGGTATAYYAFYEAPRNVTLHARYNF